MLRMMLIAAVMAHAPAAPDRPPAETAGFPSTTLGTVHVFAPAHAPTRIAVVLSGDGGWKPGEASGTTAAALARRGVLALGVDVNRVIALMARGGDRPLDLGAVLAAVAREGRARYGGGGPVILSGYSAGATLAYAAFAQSPPGRFQGLVTQGFCPDQETVRPVGDATGRTIGHRRLGALGWVYRPAPLPGPWAVIEGSREHGCAGGDVTSFVRSISAARLWRVTGISHGFGPSAAWAGDLSLALSWIGVTPPTHKSVSRAPGRGEV